MQRSWLLTGFMASALGLAAYSLGTADAQPVKPMKGSTPKGQLSDEESLKQGWAHSGTIPSN